MPADLEALFAIQAEQHAQLQQQLAAFQQLLYDQTLAARSDMAAARSRADIAATTWQTDHAAAAARQAAAEAQSSDYVAARFDLHTRELADREARTVHARRELELQLDRDRLAAAHQAAQLEIAKQANVLSQQQFEAKQTLRQFAADEAAAERKAANLARTTDSSDRTRSANYLTATKALQNLPKATSAREWVAHRSMVSNVLQHPHRLVLADNWMLVPHCVSGPLLVSCHDFMKTNEHRFAALPAGSATFNWLLEFEIAMYSDRDHLEDQAAWQALQQGMLSVREFAAVFNKNMNNWGRFSVETSEASRVRQLRLALNAHTTFFLAMPDSPCVLYATGSITAAQYTTAAVFDYLLLKEAFAPNSAVSVFGGIAQPPAPTPPPRNHVTPAQRPPKAQHNQQRSSQHANALSRDKTSGPAAGDQPPPRRRSRSPSPFGRSRRPRCVRCHQFDHYAGACETAMTPAEVRANVQKVEAARHSRTCWSCSGEGHFANACPEAPMPAEILAIWTTFDRATAESDFDVPYRVEDEAYGLHPDEHSVVATVCLLAPSASPPAPPTAAWPTSLPWPLSSSSSSASSTATSTSSPSSPSTDSSAMGAAMFDLRDDINLEADEWTVQDYVRLSTHCARVRPALMEAYERLTPTPPYVLPRRADAALHDVLPIAPGVVVDRTRARPAPPFRRRPVSPVSTGSSTLSDGPTVQATDTYWDVQFQQEPWGGSPASSDEVIHGPIGINPQPLLARIHWGSDFWRSRALTSFTAMYPNTWPSASAANTLCARRPITTPSSPS